jgi:hypothetical protein
MPTYRIIHRENSERLLWRLPSAKIVWATEHELREAVNSPNAWLWAGSYTPGQNRVMDAAEIRRGAVCEFSGEDAARLVAGKTDAILVEAPRMRTEPKDRPSKFESAAVWTFLVLSALMFLWLATK